MKKVFFVRHKRDNAPYLLVTVSSGGTEFQPLSDEADDVADVFDSVYKNRPINKQELDAALDDDFTIEGPINPTRGNLNLLQDFLSDVNQPLSPRKLAPSAKSFDISAVPLGFSDVEGKVNLTEYKARNFLYEQTKTTFNYEVKRVRAIWDPGLSIPGTGRRGGWRCPVGTRYGGQITDRFGRNCGWGVARRIANAITNIGERMEGLDDRRRGRRVERRNRRMLERLGRAEGGGRAERGLRNVADVLDGGEATSTTDVAPAPRAPRKPGRGAQARRRARNTTEALADARDRGLRDSERRRVRRELDEPNAPRTNEEKPRKQKPELTPSEEKVLRKIDKGIKAYGSSEAWSEWLEAGVIVGEENALRFPDDDKDINELARKGFIRIEIHNNHARDKTITQRNFILTEKGKKFLADNPSNEKSTPKAPRKRPRNARKPAKRPKGEARQDPTKPVGGPNETEDYAGYVNRKYDEYAENVRKIRERGGRAGFLTRREWYNINKRNLDDAWRKKGKGEAPDDFMPPTPAKKRRRQPGARKKPPVQDKEPTTDGPNTKKRKKINEEFPDQEPTLREEVLIRDAKFDAEEAVNALRVFNYNPDTNEKAQLRRKYNESAERQKRQLDALETAFEALKKNEEFKELIADGVAQEGFAKQAIEDLKAEQNALAERLQGLAANTNEKNDIVEQLIRNAVQLDYNRQVIKLSRRVREDAEKLDKPNQKKPTPIEPDADENNPIGNPFAAKVDKRIDLGIEFGDNGIGKYKPITNENIKNEQDAIDFVKNGGDLSQVPHEYWQIAVMANSSRDDVDTTTRFRMLSKNGGAIGDTKIFVFRDGDGMATNQGLVFKASTDDDNIGELIGWNLMHQVGIIKGGAVGDGKNERGKQYVILPFAFNDIQNGNEITDFGANPGEGNYPITLVNENVAKKHQAQMFAARLNQELANFVLGVHDRHRGNGMAKAVKLPNGEHMAHIVPIDLGWAGRLVQDDPLMGGGVDNRFWSDLRRALRNASDGEKAKIQKSVIAAWDNTIDRLGKVLEGGEEQFIRDAVKNIDTETTRRRAKRIYEVLSRQRNRLVDKRNELITKIGA